MNWKTVGLSLLLVDFLALSAYAVHAVGYVGFFEWALKNPATITLSADLVIALGLFTVWMVRDARERGLAFAPYVVLTLALGSAGPLAYLIRRELAASHAGEPQLSRA